MGAGEVLEVNLRSNCCFKVGLLLVISRVITPVIRSFNDLMTGVNDLMTGVITLLNPTYRG